MTTLTPMRSESYQDYFEAAVVSYANELAKSDSTSPADKLDQARQEFESHLPNGLTTPNNYLYEITDEKRKQTVGCLWFALMQVGEERIAFVSDVVVSPENRKQGYGEAAFMALEEIVQEMNLKIIGLRVFKHNDAARCLYTKLGYVVRRETEDSIFMRKYL